MLLKNIEKMSTRLPNICRERGLSFYKQHFLNPLNFFSMKRVTTKQHFLRIQEKHPAGSEQPRYYCPLLVKKSFPYLPDEPEEKK